METKKQEFVNGLFQPHKIAFFEDIFGDGFIGPGGYDAAQKYIPLLQVNTGDRVLDIGCGTGGNAFFLSQRFGASVLGTDLSTHMIDVAKGKLEEQTPEVRRKVQFQVVDADNMDFEEASFDAVFCKDAFVYVADKCKVLTQIKKWLKPGGRMLIIDHMRGTNEADNQVFDKFYKGRHWHLYTIEAQQQVIRESGFTNIMVQDNSREFVAYMKPTVADKQRILEDTSSSEEDKRHIRMEEQKLIWMQDGFLSWALFLATKPE